MPHKILRIIDSEVEAFEDAADIVREDLNDPELEDGEILEHIANAYRGKL